MKNLIAITALLLTSLLCVGQNFGEIQGKVVDEYGDGLPGVNVYTQGVSGEIGTSTDKDGKYKLKPLTSGTYNVTFSFISYSDQIVSKIKVDPNKIRILKPIVMLENSEMIEGGAEILVWVDPLIDPEETAVITMRTSDIKTNAMRTNTMAMIATMKSDIKQGTDGELYFRGSRSGAIQYNIDGVKMTTNAIRIPSAAIGSISVYTGGLPAKYGDTTGGVVVIETRSYMDLYNEYAMSK